MDDEMLSAWDRLHAAICKVECALPYQMTEAIEGLTAERLSFSNLIHSQNRARLEETTE